MAIDPAELELLDHCNEQLRGYKVAGAFVSKNGCHIMWEDPETAGREGLYTLATSTYGDAEFENELDRVFLRNVLPVLQAAPLLVDEIRQLHTDAKLPTALEYSTALAAEMVKYSKAIEGDFPGNIVAKLLAHLAAYERVVLQENNQCDHDDGVAECWHFGAREGQDG